MIKDIRLQVWELAKESAHMSKRVSRLTAAAAAAEAPVVAAAAAVAADAHGKNIANPWNCEGEAQADA